MIHRIAYIHNFFFYAQAILSNIHTVVSRKIAARQADLDPDSGPLTQGINFKLSYSPGKSQETTQNIHRAGN